LIGKRTSFIPATGGKLGSSPPVHFEDLANSLVARVLAVCSPPVQPVCKPPQIYLDLRRSPVGRSLRSVLCRSRRSKPFLAWTAVLFERICSSGQIHRCRRLRSRLLLEAPSEISTKSSISSFDVARFRALISSQLHKIYAIDLVKKI
jgi:hypothetical protein